MENDIKNEGKSLPVIENGDASKNDADPATDGLSKQEIRRRERAIKASKRMFRSVDILLDFAMNSCPYINDKNKDTIECTKDVVYDEKLLDICRFDVYSVPTEKAQPAVILIHGGGFSAGGKAYRRGHAQFLAINGFTVFCVDYGLAPDYKFPEPISHLVTAANFIYDHASEYNIDTNRIMVGGDSAGAYYSAMLAVLNCCDDYKKQFGFELKFRVFGALLVCGLYDLQTVLKTKYLLDLDDGVFLGFTGLSRSDIEEKGYRYRDYMLPYEFINEKFPPTFVIHSNTDIFCKDQGKVLVEKLDKLGVYCESYVARHFASNHCFSLNWRGEDAVAANELMISFAKRLANDKIKF